MDNLQKEVRTLKVYALCSTLLFGGLAFSSFRQTQQPTTFGEINVERINVVEKDGKPKMVISNKERFPDPVFAGKTLKRANGNPGGLLFFNDEGVECGGLAFQGKKVNEKAEAMMNLSFDQYDQDETVSLTYGEANGQRQAGLLIKDRPDYSMSLHMDKLLAIKAMKDGPDKKAALSKLRDDGVFGADRVFVGKEANKTAGVYVCDAKGKPRISMTVDASGTAQINFLDEAGKVTQSFPGGKPSSAAAAKK